MKITKFITLLLNNSASFIFIGILILFFIISGILSNIDTNQCYKAYYKQNITRCERIQAISTVNPFALSDECYCENTDRIYFKK